MPISSSSSSPVMRCLLRLRFVALPIAPLLLTGCLLGQQPQLVSIKAGEVDQVKLRCDSSSSPAHQKIQEKQFWVMVTDGAGTFRARYRILKQGHQGSVIAQGLTPDTVSLIPAGKYLVEVTHPESGSIYSAEIRRTLMPVIGAVLTPNSVLAGFSTNQQPVYKDILKDQYTYQRGGKVVLAGSVVKQCNP